MLHPSSGEHGAHGWLVHSAQGSHMFVNWTRGPTSLGFSLGLLPSQKGASLQDGNLTVRQSGGFLEEVATGCTCAGFDAPCIASDYGWCCWNAWRSVLRRVLRVSRYRRTTIN